VSSQMIRRTTRFLLANGSGVIRSAEVANSGGRGIMESRLLTLVSQFAIISLCELGSQQMKTAETGSGSLPHGKSQEFPRSYGENPPCDLPGSYAAGRMCLSNWIGLNDAAPALNLEWTAAENGLTGTGRVDPPLTGDHMDRLPDVEGRGRE